MKDLPAKLEVALARKFHEPKHDARNLERLDAGSHSAQGRSQRKHHEAAHKGALSLYEVDV